MSSKPSIPEGTPIAATDGQLQQIMTSASSNLPAVNQSTSGDTAASENNYEDYKLFPDASWPPPVFIRKNVGPHERFYIENRWHSQWSFFDKKASQNKRNYIRLQLIIGIGSVTVPVLVGIRVEGYFREILYLSTVFISLAVAIAAAIENINKYGENWRSYRQAAEDLKQEKSLYDIRAGRYADIPAPFARFVERTEEIIAQQNGRWIQSTEKQQTQSAEQIQEILDSGESDDEFMTGQSSTTAVPVQSQVNTYPATLRNQNLPDAESTPTISDIPASNEVATSDTIEAYASPTINDTTNTTQNLNQQSASPPIDIG